MREYQERRRIRKFLHSRYAIAVLVVLCAVLAHAVWGVYEKYQKSADIADRLQNDYDSLASREASLSKAITALGTSEGEEREIRDRFNVVKDGERVIVLVDNSTSSPRQASSSSEGWWGKFIDIFKF